MVFMSGHHAKVWPTVAAPNSSDRVHEGATGDLNGIVGAHAGLLQHGMHFAPIAVKLIRHVVSSCPTNRL